MAIGADGMTAAGQAPFGGPVWVARRFRRPGWGDPRLVVGIVLVAGSVVLGSWAVTSAEHTVTVLVARDALTPGEPVGRDAVRDVQVRLPDAELGRYLSPGQLPADAVAVRVVDAGELVPRAALGTPELLGTRSVAVPVSDALPDAVVAGAVVDLWRVPDPGRTGGATAVGGDAVASDAVPPAARAVATGLTVEDVRCPDGGFSVAPACVVHVVVPEDLLGQVLAVVAGRDTVRLVAVPGS